MDSETYDLAPAQEPGGGRIHHVADLGPFALLDAVATRQEGRRARLEYVFPAHSVTVSALRRRLGAYRGFEGCHGSAGPPRALGGLGAISGPHVYEAVRGAREWDVER